MNEPLLQAFRVSPWTLFQTWVKVKLSLCLTKHHAVKMYGGVEVQIHVFLTSVLDGGKWSVSRPRRFTPGERAPGTQWIERNSEE
jgi:hypothetical protein